jgi:hypothetical protein
VTAPRSRSQQNSGASADEREMEPSSRPLRTYRHAVGGSGRKGFLVSARYLPKTLQEQEQHDEFFDFEPPFDQELANGQVKRLYIWDVAGREWSVPRRDLKKLVADAKKHTVQSGGTGGGITEA